MYEMVKNILYRMKLKKLSLKKINNGSKNIKLCLNDEKRQQVLGGVFMEFSSLDNPNHMDEYYSRRERSGVLGLKLYLIDLQKFVDTQERSYGFSETY